MQRKRIDGHRWLVLPSSLKLMALAVTTCLILGHQPVHAGDATWNQNPVNSDWFNPANWTPTVPSQVATFNTSSITNVTATQSVFIESIVFKPGASAYTFTGPFGFGLPGAGIVNNSGVTQTFDISQGMSFLGDATAGDNVILGSAGPSFFGALFSDDSSAGSATIIMTNTSGHFSFLTFKNNSSAASSTIRLNQGGYASFQGTSTLANATLVANDGAVIVLRNDSEGGTARVELNNGSVLVLSQRTTSTVTIGSLEGDGGGNITLGSTNLSVGSNGLSTTFSGVLIDGAGHGGLTKIGSGTLTLSGASTYTGGTTVEEGTLLLKTGRGSATGDSAVQVNGGTFGGRSNITGPVTIGSGSGPGAFLAPGVKGPGTLVIKNTLTFKADGAYNCDLSLGQAKADQIVAKGVTIESGAQFALLPKGHQTLAIGTVFTVINNRTHQPISGVFANLPDNSTFTANGNNFQVSYEGGDGNDLTLTVVP